MIMTRVDEVAAALREDGSDCWLVYDFRGGNPLAMDLLGLSPEKLASRRLAVTVTRDGRVRQLVHAIEQEVVPEHGERRVYLSRQSFVDGVKWLLEGVDVLTTEYVADAANPYLSFLDAGTMDLIRPLVKEVRSSGDLVQLFQATWSDEQWQSHLEADRQTAAAHDLVREFVRDRVRGDGGVDESDVMAVILKHFEANSVDPDHDPIVGRGPNGGLPHYETGTGADTRIREGDPLLVDLWGRVDRPGTIFSDVTQMNFVGETVPENLAAVFGHVAAARDASIDLLKQRFAADEPVHGWEVDRACRDVIEAAGFGDAFTHRTGHSMTTELHGSGAHMDDLEVKETRRVLPRTGFSIEPGVYLPDHPDYGFGCRSEVNVWIGPDNAVHVTGRPQTEVAALLA